MGEGAKQQPPEWSTEVDQWGMDKKMQLDILKKTPKPKNHNKINIILEWKAEAKPKKK